MGAVLVKASIVAEVSMELLGIMIKDIMLWTTKTTWSTIQVWLGNLTENAHRQPAGIPGLNISYVPK